MTVSEEPAQKFPINLGILPIRLLLLLFATRQGNAYVELSDDTVTVRMGPLFRRSFPRDGVSAPHRAAGRSSSASAGGPTSEA